MCPLLFSSWPDATTVRGRVATRPPALTRCWAAQVLLPTSSTARDHPITHAGIRPYPGLMPPPQRAATTDGKAIAILRSAAIPSGCVIWRCESGPISYLIVLSPGNWLDGDVSSFTLGHHTRWFAEQQ